MKADICQKVAAFTAFLVQQTFLCVSLQKLSQPVLKSLANLQKLIQLTNISRFVSVSNQTRTVVRNISAIANTC
jgi:hypothetical protein